MKMTGINARLQVEADAASFGIIPVTSTHGKQQWTVTCSHCGKQERVFNPNVQGADWLVAHFTKRGWEFDRRVAQYCSTLHRREAKDLAREQRKETEMNQQKPPAPPLAGPDPKIVVAVIRLLEEFFDTTKRVYTNGYSDERIAKETGASLDFVKRYRTDAYGELAEDPEFAALKLDMKAMDDLFAQSLKSLEQSFAQQIGELRTRLEALRHGRKL